MKIPIQEYERDQTKYHLENGLRDKADTMEEFTQKGTPKALGRKTTLDEPGDLDMPTIKAMSTAIQ